VQHSVYASLHRHLSGQVCGLAVTGKVYDLPYVQYNTAAMLGLSL